MRVLKEPAYPDLVRSHGQAQTLELTDELLSRISQRNGYISPDQVKATLEAGQIVYTEFNRYRRG